MPKKPFAFNLSALTIQLVLGSCALSLSACSPNANVQGKGVDALQGEWQQRKEAVQQQLVNYTLYHFNFTCDSFYVAMESHSKVNYGADTCMNSGHWTEYAKGKYTRRQDTLIMKGFFCNADYSLKDLGGCFRAGVYEDNVKWAVKSASLIQLTSTASVLPMNLHLVKRINCIPKPL